MTSNRILLRGGHVLDPASGTDEQLDVLIDGEKIVALGKSQGAGPSGVSASDVEVIDVADRWVVPGLIDLHVHLREPGQEDKETIATGAAAAVRGGFTSICCMPNTDPALDTPGWIGYVASRAALAGAGLRGIARVYPIGAITENLAGKNLTNMSALRQAGAVALSDDGRMVMDALLMRRAMEYAKGVGIPLTLHSIDERLCEGGMMNEGAISTALGLGGCPAHAEIIAIARDIALAELTGAKIHIAHVSTRGAVELIREAKRKGIAVTGEVTPHHLALTEEKLMGYDTNFKMNPPLRTEDDRCALVDALRDGTLDAIATDHAPHTERDKDLPFDEAPFGVTGLETAVAVTHNALIESGALTPLRWIECLTSAPARIFNLPGGALTVGGPADITVINPHHEKNVIASEMVSLGKNSCFLGETYRCWPVMTFVGGRRNEVI